MANQDLINDANDALAAKILTEWPEVTPVDRLDGGTDFGIYFSEDIAALNLKNMREPFCIINVGQWTKADEFGGLSSHVERSTYIIYYVRAANVNNRSLRQKIKKLQSFLNDPDNDIAEVVDGIQIENTDMISHSRILPMNREFIDRELPLRAGAMSVDLLLTDDV